MYAYVLYSTMYQKQQFQGLLLAASLDNDINCWKNYKIRKKYLTILKFNFRKDDINMKNLSFLNQMPIRDIFVPSKKV
jgi:hypothetical protein